MDGVRDLTRGDARALIIVCGLPGSGKTTVATQISTERPAVRFSPDDWLEALGHDTWDDDMRSRIEDLQKSVIAEVLRSGASAVIEWGTWQRRDRDSLRLLARSLGARAELVVLDAPLEVLHERVVRRGTEDPPITWAQMREWEESFERPDAEEEADFDAFTYVTPDSAASAPVSADSSKHSVESGPLGGA